MEEEKSEGETEEESSEYEEYTDSEEETGPRLKPVFVRKYVHVSSRPDMTFAVDWALKKGKYLSMYTSFHGHDSERHDKHSVINVCLCRSVTCTLPHID